MREFFDRDRYETYIEDTSEATNNSLEDIKNCFQHRPLKTFCIRLQKNVSTRRELKTKLYSQKYSSTKSTLLLMLYMNTQTSKIG